MKLPKLVCLVIILLRVMFIASELSCWNFLVDGNRLIGKIDIPLSSITVLLLHVHTFKH